MFVLNSDHIGKINGKKNITGLGLGAPNSVNIGIFGNSQEKMLT